MRSGYSSEYRIKQELLKEFGEYGVIKVAIGSFGSDFLIAGCGEFIKVLEVKETKKKVKYFSEREKKQLERIKKFAQYHHIPAELVVVFRKGKGKPIIKHYLEIYKPRK